MQTILGAGGPIGTELAKALKEYTSEIRLVSRNPEKVNETDQIFVANLLDPVQLESAVKGSAIVYVTIGFEYSKKVWRQNWPKFIRALIEICEKETCKLVFFDNVYMYDKEHLNPMTEDTPVNPPSKKGEVRAEIAEMIMMHAKAGRLKALIARCADYYGPSTEGNSILTEMVFKPFEEGRKANWLGSDKFRHSFTYTLDAARATARLGNTEKAYGQVWHLPTASNPPTGKEWIEAIAAKMKVQPRYQVAPKFLVRILGLFMPIMRESFEMVYQYDRDYVFDSSRFEREFDLHPTSYEDGIDEIIRLNY